MPQQRIAIYARVSTRDKQEVYNQLDALRAFIASQPEWVLTHEYIDKESGFKESAATREQFKQLFADASKRKFDIVLFWALDRFTREGSYKTQHYLNQLDGYGIRFRSFTEQYLDTCGIFRDAVIAILATIAKQESIRMSERIKAGLSRAKAEGKQCGVSRRPNTSPSEIVKLKGQGMSYRAIGKVLGISKTVVERRIREWEKEGKNSMMERVEEMKVI